MLHLPYVDSSQVKWLKQEPLVMLLVIVGEKCFTCFVAACTSPYGDWDSRPCSTCSMTSHFTEITLRADGRSTLNQFSKLILLFLTTGTGPSRIFFPVASYPPCPHPLSLPCKVNYPAALLLQKILDFTYSHTDVHSFILYYSGKS